MQVNILLGMLNDESTPLDNSGLVAQGFHETQSAWHDEISIEMREFTTKAGPNVAKKDKQPKKLVGVKEDGMGKDDTVANSRGVHGVFPGGVCVEHERARESLMEFGNSQAGCADIFFGGL